MGLYRYWQIENGDGAPATTDERVSIATALDVKVNDIAWPELEKARASA